jgi:dTDP-4-dehydrorhamnose reductase
MTTRWLIAGSRGQLGHALGQHLAADPSCEIAAAVDLPEVDVADAGAIERLFEGFGSQPPDVVVNAAAFTHVDRCEREPEAAHRGNALAPALLAEACAKRGIRLAHVSTDYVFPGDAKTPYTETDEPAPRSAYGRTKLEGEQRVAAVSRDFLIVRTSWVFGRGRNFIAAILAQAEKRRASGSSEPLRVVADQFGRPTYAYDLAEGILGLLACGAGGLYHMANRDVASWWDLARATLDEAGYPELNIDRIRSEELDVDAPRPLWSVLDSSKAEAKGVTLRHWRDALRAFLQSAESPLTNEKGGV